MLLNIVIVRPSISHFVSEVIPTQSDGIKTFKAESLANNLGSDPQRQVTLVLQCLRIHDPQLLLLREHLTAASIAQVALDFETSVSPSLDNMVLRTCLDAESLKYLPRRVPR